MFTLSVTNRSLDNNLDKINLPPISVVTRVNVQEVINISDRLSSIVDTNQYSFDGYQFLGEGNVSASADGIITFQSDSPGPNRILFTMKNNSNEFLNGAIDISVNEANNRPPIVNAFETVVYASSENEIDISNYVSDLDGDEIRLLSVESYNLPIAINDNFKLQVSSPVKGTYYASYYVIDARGAISSNVILFNVIDNVYFTDVIINGSDYSFYHRRNLSNHAVTFIN